MSISSGGAAPEKRRSLADALTPEQLKSFEESMQRVTQRWRDFEEKLKATVPGYTKLFEESSECALAAFAWMKLNHLSYQQVIDMTMTEFEAFIDLYRREHPNRLGRECGRRKCRAAALRTELHRSNDVRAHDDSHGRYPTNVASGR